MGLESVLARRAIGSPLPLKMPLEWEAKMGSTVSIPLDLGLYNISTFA